MQEGQGFINIEANFDEDEKVKEVIQKEKAVPLNVEFDNDAASKSSKSKSEGPEIGKDDDDDDGNSSESSFNPKRSPIPKPQNPPLKLE